MATETTQSDIDALRQTLEELQRQVNQAQTSSTIPGLRDDGKIGRKPDPFNGSRKNRAVQSWMKSMDDYFELNPGQRRTERRAILTAASYLIDPAKGDYNTYVESNGEFETWKDLKRWLNDAYNLVDPTNTSRKNFFTCKQRVGETPDEYHRRFLDFKNLLDTPLPETYVVYFFAHGLQTHYLQQIHVDNVSD